MTTGQQVIYERPPEGLARGPWPVPWWIVAGLCALIVVAATVFLIVRLVVGHRLSKQRVGPPPP